MPRSSLAGAWSSSDGVREDWETKTVWGCTANRWCCRIYNSYHTESWEQMTAIKSRILQMWDGAPAPVKISCIKFAQRVVLAQTVSNGMEQKVGGLIVCRGFVT